jgi:hypothetical protein
MNRPKNFITVYESIGGWKAVEMHWEGEGDDGGWEPWQTGIGAYETREEAGREAREWAHADDLEVKL